MFETPKVRWLNAGSRLEPIFSRPQLTSSSGCTLFLCCTLGSLISGVSIIYPAAQAMWTRGHQISCCLSCSDLISGLHISNHTRDGFCPTPKIRSPGLQLLLTTRSRCITRVLLFLASSQHPLMLLPISHLMLFTRSRTPLLPNG